MESMIHVGATKEAVEAARDAIMAILAASADEKTKRAAFKVFTEICKVENTVITDCVFGSLPNSEE